MQTTSSNAYYNNPLAFQAAPDASGINADNKPNNEYNRITVKDKDYPRVMDLLHEVARRYDVQMTIGQPESSDLDYGDGPMQSSTFSFDFHPDKADGTYSPEYLKSVNQATKTFYDWLKIEGITNYAPES